MSTVAALRSPVHVYDAPNGDRWRGGLVVRLEGDVAVVRALAELGTSREYRGPAARLPCREVGAPLVARLVGAWPYQIAELRDSTFASASDAARAAAGEPGVFGIVPWELTGAARVLWRDTGDTGRASAEWSW